MMQIGHLPFYLADPRCEVVRIAESRQSLVNMLSQQLGAHKVVHHHHALLDDPQIDAVVISAPRPATGPLTLEVLKAGKHVIAEKPMAHTADQARCLVETARTLGLTYAVGFMKRYDPGVQAAKALVDDCRASNRLGRLLIARFYDYSKNYVVSPPPHTRPAESRSERFEAWQLSPNWLPEQFVDTYQWFLNSASHDVNLLRLLFPNDLEVVGAQCTSPNSIIATLRADDISIVLEVSKTEAGRWLEGAEFLFEKGRIRLAIPSPMAVDGVSRVTLEEARGGPVAQQVETGTGWSFAHQATGFVDALTGGPEPLTTGADGLADMELTEAIWRHIKN